MKWAYGFHDFGAPCDSECFEEMDVGVKIRRAFIPKPLFLVLGVSISHSELTLVLEALRGVTRARLISSKEAWLMKKRPDWDRKKILASISHMSPNHNAI